MARNKKTSESLFKFMNLLIVLLMKNGQYRTMLHYKATLNSFKRYRDNKDIALDKIDAEVMRSYEAYLHHTAKVCSNTKGQAHPLCRPPFLGNGSKRQRYLYLSHQRGTGPSFRTHHTNLSPLHQKLRGG